MASLVTWRTTNTYLKHCEPCHDLARSLAISLRNDHTVQKQTMRSLLSIYHGCVHGSWRTATHLIPAIPTICVSYFFCEVATAGAKMSVTRTDVTSYYYHPVAHFPLISHPSNAHCSLHAHTQNSLLALHPVHVRHRFSCCAHSSCQHRIKNP